jgi:S-adenosylmethionine hydrolase
MGPIAFLTDFGTDDWFVGALKGVALGIAPEAQVVDITHHVEPGDIRSASFVLKSCHAIFPEQTVFVVVVDPGVGGTRRVLAARADNRYYIGPDNGVLSPALEDADDVSVWNITNDQYYRRPLSATFHGRDIFTPVGAHLAAGVSVEIMGTPCDDFIRIPLPEPTVKNGSISGEIIYIDHFGNAFTNITSELLKRVTVRSMYLPKVDRELPLGKYYTEVDDYEPLGLINSEGYLEVAVNKGNAAKKFGVEIGDSVILRS